MDADFAPVRTMSALTRSPRTAPSASMRIDFPAPVSPVSTLSPGPNARFTLSMMAKFRMASSTSMANLPALAPLNVLPFEKSGHAVDAAAGFDALADVHGVAAHACCFVPRFHVFAAGRHQDFA